MARRAHAPHPPLPRPRVRNTRRTAFGPLIAQAGGVVVILGALFTGIQKLADVIATVQTLVVQSAVTEKTLGTLVASSDGVQRTVNGVQNHLRMVDQQEASTNTRLTAIESYLLSYGKHTTFRAAAPQPPDTSQ